MTKEKMFCNKCNKEVEVKQTMSAKCCSECRIVLVDECPHVKIPVIDKSDVILSEALIPLLEVLWKDMILGMMVTLNYSREDLAFYHKSVCGKPATKKWLDNMQKLIKERKNEPVKEDK